MKTNLKRLTALILALSMALSLLSTGAWAADLPEGTGTVAVQSEAEPQAEPEEEAGEPEAEPEPEEEPEAEEPEPEESEPEESEAEPEQEPEAGESEAEPEEESEEVEEEAEEVEEVEPEEEESEEEVTPEEAPEELTAQATGVASVTSGSTTTYYATLSAAVTELNAAANGSTLTLYSDVTTASTINVTGTKILDLNGYGIRMTGSGSVINVGNGANLTLNDSNGTRAHAVTLSGYRGTAVADGTGTTSVTNGTGTVYFTGGYITGGTGVTNIPSFGYAAGGMYVGGTVTMNAGTIIGNTAGNTSGHNGGGVFINGGTFTLTGGSIIYNKSGYGAGVYVVSGTFNMTGGTIRGNLAGGAGGGVRIQYAYPNGKFNVSGSPVITGNTNSAGTDNVFLKSGDFYITVNGRLTETANICVTKDGGAGVITNSTDTSLNDTSKFTSDNPSYMVGKNAAGQLLLGAPYNVTYNANGATSGSAPTDASSPYASGSAVTVLGNTGNLTKTGFEFAGWNTAADGNGTTYVPGDSTSGTFTISANTTLYAKWVHYVASVTSGDKTTRYSTFTDALSAWTEGSTLKLLDDVTHTSIITVPDGEHTLDLNGHGLIMGTTRGFIVTGSAKLNVIDSNKTTVHKYKIASPQSNGAGLATVNDALTGTEGTDYRTFTGGYITGANNPGNGSQGGAFYVTQNGVLNMDGGTVIGNSAGGGGAIFLSSSSTTTEKSVIKNANLIGNRANNCGSVIQQEKGNMVFENCHVFYNYTSNVNAFHLAVHGGSTLIKNCTLEKNYSGNGFTVLICNWADSGTSDLTLDDTIIKENDRGLSVAPNAGSNLIIKGNTSITGNSITNLKLFSGRTLAIDGQLSAKAAIGVTMDTPGVFTNTASDKLSYNDMSKFTSDNPSYMVGKNAAGQLLLGAPYTVTYNANGGSGTAPVDSSSPYASGSAVNVLKNTLTRAGYTFAGWKIGTENTIYANSADNIAGAAESFTITENTTLTAQWTAIPATAPTISGVTGATLTYGYTSGSVSVTATAETGHSITGYQWYSNTTNSNTGGTSINGATSASYTIPTGKNADTTEYYYCVVTATRNDNSQTAPTTSGVATVKVDKAPAPATTTLTDKQKPDGKKDLEYTGQPQDLVTGPSELPKGYIKVQYSIDDGKTWTDEVPTGEDSGTYTVKMKYIGDDNHTDFDGDDIPVTIDQQAAPATTTLTDKQKPDGKKDLEYTGQPQDLVTGPSDLPDGYTKVQYSIDDGKTWTDEVPTGEDSGTYTVKMKYIGDDNHTDFEGESVSVTIGKAAAPAATTLPNTQKPAAKKNLAHTGQPQELVSAPSTLPKGYTKVQYSIDDGKTWTDEVPTGKDSGTYTVKMKYIGDDNHTDFEGESVSVTIGKAAAPAASTLTQAQKPAAKKKLVYTGKPLALVTPPTKLPDGYTSVVYAIGTNAATPPAESAYSTTIPKAAKAGTYYVWYKLKGDKNHKDSKPKAVTVTIKKTDINNGLRASEKNGVVTLRYGEVSDADSYVVCFRYCGTGSQKPLMTVKGAKNTSVTIKRFGGKKINRKRSYTLWVVAKKGEKVLKTSVEVHVVGSRNKGLTNAASVSVKKPKVTLKKNKTSAIAATVKKARKGKFHKCRKVPLIRYFSSNRKVATVNKKGVIKAVGSGKCKIKVMTLNGAFTYVTVTVK